MANLEFNETDFPEFDPTPYDGGYDISTTYGKPLPPSEKICYPRASSNQIQQKTTQQNESMPPFPDNNLSKKPDFDTPIEPNFGEEPPQCGNDYVPKGYNVNGYYDYEREVPLPEENGYTLGQVPLPPNEYVEPCASFFGYWPCLLKDYNKNAVQQCCKDRGYSNEWRKTEDYFFGSSYPFGETRDNDFNRVDFHYGYVKHYVEEPAYVQEYYKPDSQKLSSHVDFNYGYEEHNMERPTYVQEEYNPHLQKLSSHFNYGYEKHYMERPTYVQEDFNTQLQSLKLSNQVENSYGYDKNYTEQPGYLQEDLWSEKLSNQVDFNYGYDKHYTGLPTYVEEDYVPVEEDYVPDLESQKMYSQADFFQGYDKHFTEQPTHILEDFDMQFHPQKLSSQEDFNYGYERSYKDQPGYVQDDYNPQSWSQKLSYSSYEA